MGKEAGLAAVVASAFLVFAVLNHGHFYYDAASQGRSSLEQQDLYAESPGVGVEVGRGSSSKVARAVARFEARYKAVMGKGPAALDSALDQHERLPTAQLSEVDGGAASHPGSASAGGSVLADLLGRAGVAVDQKYETEKTAKNKALKSLSEVETQLLPKVSKQDALAAIFAAIDQREKRIEKRMEFKEEHPKLYAAQQKANAEEKAAEGNAEAKKAEALAEAKKAEEKAAATETEEQKELKWADSVSHDAHKAHKPAVHVADAAAKLNSKQSLASNKPVTSSEAKPKEAAPAKLVAPAKDISSAKVEEAADKEVVAAKREEAKTPLTPAEKFAHKVATVVKDKSRRAAGGGTEGVDGQLAAAEAVAMQSRTPTEAQREAAASKKQKEVDAAPEDEMSEQARRAAGGGAEGVDGQLAAAERVAAAAAAKKANANAATQTLTANGKKAAAKAAPAEAKPSGPMPAAAKPVVAAVKKVVQKHEEAKRPRPEINPLSVIDKALSAEAAAAAEAKAHQVKVAEEQAEARAVEEKEARLKASEVKAAQALEAKEAAAAAKLAPAPAPVAAAASSAAAHVAAPAAPPAPAAAKAGGDSTLDEITMAMHKEAEREKDIKAAAPPAEPVNPEVKRLKHLFGGRVGSKIERLFVKMKKSKAAAEALAKRASDDSQADLLKPLPMPEQLKKQAESKQAAASTASAAKAEDKNEHPGRAIEKHDRDMDKIALKDLRREEGQQAAAAAASDVEAKGGAGAQAKAKGGHNMDNQALKDLNALQKAGLIPPDASSHSGQGEKSVDGAAGGGAHGGKGLPRLMQHLFGKQVAKKYARETVARKSGQDEALSQEKFGPKIISAPKMSAEDLQAARDLKILSKNPKLGLLGGGAKNSGDSSSSLSGDDDGSSKLGEEGSF